MKAKEDIKKFIKERERFYEFLDENIPKNNLGGFDFENAKKINPKEMYELFFKFDYSARKLCALASKEL
jgi:hypothetical protein